jgi:nucleotide sugar dehydrogenase
MKIGIVGLGVVGQALRDGFGQIGHDVVHYDIAHADTSLEQLVDSEIVYICVPTNTVNNKCDTSQVDVTIESLHTLNYSGTIAIKSTVIPGTTQRLIESYPDLNICFVPEFLRAQSALADFVNHNDVLIVGTNNNSIYHTIVSCHSHLPRSVVQISPTEAEITKYFSNLFNALRIVFANGIYEVATALGADYQQILNAIIKRPGITPDYLNCSKYYRGFAGVCLPKDAQAFSTFVDELELSHLQIFRTIVQDNQHHLK